MSLKLGLHPPITSQTQTIRIYWGMQVCIYADCWTI